MKIKPPPPKDDPFWDNARKFEERIEAMRRDAGKPLPSDFPIDSAEFKAAEEDVLRDIILALGGDPDQPELDLGALDNTRH